ncbi:MAG: DUF2339 domain-containing protein [Planctomycetota bacterium]
MEEVLLALVALGAFLALLSAPLLALVAVLRGAALRKRVDALERELRALRQGAVSAAEPRTEPAPAAKPSPGPGDAAPAPLRSADPAASSGPAEGAGEPTGVDDSAGAASPADSPEAMAPDAPSEPAPPPVPLHRRIDWERWAGVRGAAVLGGIFAALASILFVRLAFENQWIDPAARCWSGAGLGLAGIVAGAFLRRRDYRFAPSALEGAGIVALYAAVWAAHRLYGYLSLLAALPLLAAVTALACVLAVRHRSQLTAVLGLVGGFSAAYLLSADAEQPFGLFGYLLLLDLGLLFVGRRSGWPSLGVLALLGTFLFESLWIFGSMDVGGTLVGLAILAVFATVFALTGLSPAQRARRGWLLSQSGAVLLPFAFAVHFAADTDFHGHMGSVAALVALLGAAGCVLARAQRAPWLAVGAAAAAVSVLGVWVLGTELEVGGVWRLALLGGGIAAVFHLFAELERRAGGGFGHAPAAALTAGGLIFLVALAPPVGARAPLGAWAFALALPAALLVRQAALAGRGLPALAAGSGTGLGLLLYAVEHRDAGGELLPPPLLYLAAVAVAALALLAAGQMLTARARWGAWHAVGLTVVPGLAGLSPLRRLLEDQLTAMQLGLLAVVGVLAVAAGRLGSWLWIAAGALIVVVLQLEFTFNLDAPYPLVQLASLSVAALLLAAAPLPFAAGRERRAPWIAAALVVPLAYPLIHWHYVDRFSDKVAALPLVIAGASVGALGWVAARRLAGAPALDTARAWFGSVALVLLATALPVQLEFGWPLVAIALAALALAAFGRRIGSSAVGAVAGIAALAATLCLVGRALEAPYEHEGVPIASWVSYVHLVPASALGVAAWILRRPERGPEQRADRLLAGLVGLCAVVLGFFWLTFQVLDFFGKPGARLSFAGERMPTRDLAASLAWAVYALALLLAGVGARVGGLRWASLLLFLGTIAKVFLYDLGELDGLHRVGSLAGLAVSLITVSLLYQRFVFRRA